MLQVARHSRTPFEALSQSIKSSRLDFADFAVLLIVLGTEFVCAAAVVTLFVFWLMSLNTNRFAISGSECAHLGRSGIQCAESDDPNRRLNAESKPVADCPNLGKGGRLCSPALN